MMIIKIKIIFLISRNINTMLFAINGNFSFLIWLNIIIILIILQITMTVTVLIVFFSHIKAIFEIFE